MIRRETKQRETVLNVLRHTESHPKADWIYDEVRKILPNISKGTVYRNLKLLRDEGKIAELNLGGTVSRYEGNLDNHYHFRCVKCHKIFDLDQPVAQHMDEAVAKRTGFKVFHHQLEFRGVCNTCPQ